jgi:Proton-conducting membrane transporter
LSFCHFNIGVDGISLYFVLLTAFVTPVALLSNYNNIKINLKYFLISFLLLETLQIAVFVVLDLFLFYVFFESVLPILFTVIILYGSGEEKVRSALLLFLYTLLGSLFMLLAILQIFNYVGSTDFQLLELSEINLENQKWLWLSLSFSKRDMTYKNLHFNSLPKSKKSFLPYNECKDLVVYGSNLSSTVNYPRFTSLIRHMVQIPFNLENIILGILISDAWLFKNNAGAREILY